MVASVCFATEGDGRVPAGSLPPERHINLLKIEMAGISLSRLGGRGLG